MKQIKTLISTFHYNRPAISSRLLLETVVTFGLILAILIPRLLDLKSFVTTDERLWLERSGRFYWALAHHDFAATFQKSHPGVTVMWAGLVGYRAVFPNYYQEGKNKPISLYRIEQIERESNLPLRLLIAGRMTMVVIHLIVLILSFLFASRIFGKLPALIGFLLIAFDPFHIALSTVLHLDGLLADLGLLSLLAFLVYLNERDNMALVVSAIAAGSAWLTKSPGFFLIPVIFLLALIDFVRSKNTWVKAGWSKPAFHYMKALMGWGVIALLIFCLLWPAMWVDPVGSLSRVLTDAIGYAEGGHESALFFNGHIYTNGEIPDSSFYLISFLWRTTPVTLLGLLTAFVLLIRWTLGFRLDRKSNFPAVHDALGPNDRQMWAVVALLILALGFGALMSMGLKKFDRYIIPSIVLLDLVAGVGLVWLAGWIGQYLRDEWKATVHSLLLLAFVAVQAMLAWRSFPYFISYYNPMLGGSRQAIKVMQVGWGEGLDQAAQYINSQPNSDRIRVISWYGSGSFSYFSKSRVIPTIYDHPWTAADWNQFNKANYVVVYIHEWQRNLPPEILERVRDTKPEYSVWIDGLEYVRVYKIQ